MNGGLTRGTGGGAVGRQQARRADHQRRRECEHAGELLGAFETGTVNGQLNVAFPMTVHGEIGRRLSTDIGSGGPTIHVETTNGGVNIKKASM